MKKIDRIPLPDSLEPYAALVLYLHYKKGKKARSRTQNAGQFLAEAANVASIPMNDVEPWLPLFVAETTEAALNHSLKLGKRLGHRVPVALLKGYMESQGFHGITPNELSDTIYSLTIIIGGLGIFEYDDFNDLRTVVEYLYTGHPKWN